MFSYRYETRYGDFKNYDEIKPSTVLDMLQDIAIKHSQECGYGLLGLRDMKMVWFLQGIKVHFDKPIRTFEPVDVHTAVKNMKGFISERGSIIEQNGEQMAKAIALWFSLDSESLKPRRITEDMVKTYGRHDFEDDFFNYKKPQLGDADCVNAVRVSNKEIDTNRHLNNQKSAELLMDALPFDFHFTDMNVLYKSPAYLGDELELCMKEIPNGYYVHLQTKAKEICVAGVFENITK